MIQRKSAADASSLKVIGLKKFYTVRFMVMLVSPQEKPGPSILVKGLVVGD